MRDYLIQVEADPSGPIDPSQFVRRQARDHRDAASAFAFEQPPGRYRILVATDKPDNKHPNGMPITVFCLDLIHYGPEETDR